MFFDKDIWFLCLWIFLAQLNNVFEANTKDMPQNDKLGAPYLVDNKKQINLQTWTPFNSNILLFWHPYISVCSFLSLSTRKIYWIQKIVMSGNFYHHCGQIEVLTNFSSFPLTVFSLQTYQFNFSFSCIYSAFCLLLCPQPLFS